MAPMTRAQRRKAAEAPAPQTLSPPNTKLEAGRPPTPADPIPARTSPRNNPRPPTINAIPSCDLTPLSTSDHTTHRLTRSEAGRLYPAPLPTPIRAPIFTTCALLNLEDIAANQEILARNVEALHERMGRLENLLQELIRGKNERAEGYHLLEEQKSQDSNDESMDEGEEGRRKNRSGKKWRGKIGGGTQAEGRGDGKPVEEEDRGKRKDKRKAKEA
ncbi:hypothetical protein RUND412_007237 [Rhizina undulata]